MNHYTELQLLAVHDYTKDCKAQNEAILNNLEAGSALRKILVMRNEVFDDMLYGLVDKINAARDENFRTMNPIDNGSRSDDIHTPSQRP